MGTSVRSQVSQHMPLTRRLCGVVRGVGLNLNSQVESRGQFFQGANGNVSVMAVLKQLLLLCRDTAKPLVEDRCCVLFTLSSPGAPKW